MSAAAILVYRGHDLLRYRVTGDGETGGTVTIDNATLRADAEAGPLLQIARAKTDGIGTIAAGTPLTQAQARGLLLADGIVGNGLVPRARCLLTDRFYDFNTAIPRASYVDANVDGAGEPVVEVSVAPSTVTYLDIVAIGGYQS